MSSAHEIISLQVGNYSNFVGAHLFNIQQEYLNSESEFDPVVFWQQGQRTLAGVRQLNWAPRVLVFDLKHNWCCPFNLSSKGGKKSNSKAEREKALQEAERNVLWQGSLERFGELDEDNELNQSTTSEKRKREAVKLTAATSVLPDTKDPSSLTSAISSKLGNVGLVEQDFQSWSEFVQWPLHSPDKSSFQLPNFSTNSETECISTFGQGFEIFSKLEDEVTDGIRFYAEDCDFFQGFHLLVDQDDGFAGLSKGILTHISDEYEKKSCFTIGVTPSNSKYHQNEDGNGFRRRMSNTALCWNAFSQYSSVFTNLGLCNNIFKPNPTSVSVPGINYKADSMYESSSYLAAAIDSLQLSCLTNGNSLNFTEMIGVLNGYGHTMTVVGSAFPLILGEYASSNNFVKKSLFQTLSEMGLDKILFSLTPGAALSSVVVPAKSIGNFIMTRGVSSEEAVSNQDKELLKRQFGMDSKNINSMKSVLDVYLQETQPKSVNIIRTVESPFRMKSPFPAHLIDTTFLQTQTRFRYQNQDIWSLPTMVSAHNSIETGDLLEKLVDQACIEKMKKSNFVEHNEIEIDDYKECIDNLRVLRDAYSKSVNL